MSKGILWLIVLLSLPFAVWFGWRAYDYYVYKWKHTTGLRFDEMARDYVPSLTDLPDLNGKSILVMLPSYRSAKCQDTCVSAVRGSSGATLYFAILENHAGGPFARIPDDAEPQFTKAIDLRSEVDGRIVSEPDPASCVSLLNWQKCVSLISFAEGEKDVSIDYVLIERDLKNSIRPALLSVFDDHDLISNLGEVQEVFAAVQDDQAFRLDHRNTIYMQFSKADSLLYLGQDGQRVERTNIGGTLKHVISELFDAPPKRFSIETVICPAQAVPEIRTAC